MSEKHSSIEFLMSNIINDKVFTSEFIQAISSVVWQAEKGRRLEKEIESHAPDGRNYTNQQYVELLNENIKLRELLKK